MRCFNYPPPSALKHPRHQISPSVPLSTQHRLQIIELCFAILFVPQSIPLCISPSPHQMFIFPALPLVSSLSNENAKGSFSCSIGPSNSSPWFPAIAIPKPKHSLIQTKHVLSLHSPQSVKASSSCFDVGLRRQMWQGLRSIFFFCDSLLAVSFIGDWCVLGEVFVLRSSNALSVA